MTPKRSVWPSVSSMIWRGKSKRRFRKPTRTRLNWLPARGPAASGATAAIKVLRAIRTNAANRATGRTKPASAVASKTRRAKGEATAVLKRPSPKASNKASNRVNRVKAVRNQATMIVGNGTRNLNVQKRISKARVVDRTNPASALKRTSKVKVSSKVRVEDKANLVSAPTHSHSSSSSRRKPASAAVTSRTIKPQETANALKAAPRVEGRDETSSTGTAEADPKTVRARRSRVKTTLNG